MKETIAYNDSSTWALEEYEQVRREITERAKILHSFITLGTILYLPILITIFWLMSQGAPRELIELFLFSVPFIYAGLLFNYQANQMTLEGLAYHSDNLIRTYREQSKEGVSTWDDYYGQHKLRYRLISFFKVTPLLFPMLIPLLALLFQVDISETHSVLFGADLLLLGIVLINFRYKWNS